MITIGKTVIIRPGISWLASVFVQKWKRAAPVSDALQMANGVEDLPVSRFLHDSNWVFVAK